MANFYTMWKVLPLMFGWNFRKKSRNFGMALDMYSNFLRKRSQSRKCKIITSQYMSLMKASLRDYEFSAECKVPTTVPFTKDNTNVKAFPSAVMV